MKRILLLFIPLLMVSCGYKAAISEEDDLFNGRIYDIDCATVTYNNGITLSFAGQGALQRLDFEGESLGLDTIALLFRDKKCYLLHKTQFLYSDMGYMASFDEFSVPTAQYLFTGAFRCRTEQIAGVDCNMLTCYNSQEKYEVAAYHRVRMYERNATEADYLLNSSFIPVFHNNSAVSFSPKVISDTIFSLAHYHNAAKLSAAEVEMWNKVFNRIKTELGL